MTVRDKNHLQEGQWLCETLGGQTGNRLGLWRDENRMSLGPKDMGRQDVGRYDVVLEQVCVDSGWLLCLANQLGLDVSIIQNGTDSFSMSLSLSLYLSFSPSPSPSLPLSLSPSTPSSQDGAGALMVCGPRG